MQYPPSVHLYFHTGHIGPGCPGSGEFCGCCCCCQLRAWLHGPERGRYCLRWAGPRLSAGSWYRSAHFEWHHQFPGSYSSELMSSCMHLSRYKAIAGGGGGFSGFWRTPPPPPHTHTHTMGGFRGVSGVSGNPLGVSQVFPQFLFTAKCLWPHVCPMWLSASLPMDPNSRQSRLNSSAAGRCRTTRKAKADPGNGTKASFGCPTIYFSLIQHINHSMIISIGATAVV